MFAPKKILVPTDFSEQSDTALKKALDIAYQYQSTIYLLHVIDVRFCLWAFSFGGEFRLADSIRAEEDRCWHQAWNMLEKQMKCYALAQKVEIIPIVKFGLPRSMIMREQKERRIDLMVLGSKKRKGWIRPFIGSMVSPIVGSTSPPSLVVHC